MKRTAILLALTLWILPGAAAAAPCDAPGLQRGEPIRVPGSPADFGTLPPACPGSDVSFLGGGGAAIAVDDFYGSLLAGGAFEGRYAFYNVWISVRTPGPEYRLAANASLQSTTLDLGAGSVGVHVPTLVSKVNVAPFARLLIPTETVYQRARRFGGEAGMTGTWVSGPNLEITAGVLGTYLAVHNGTFVEHDLYVVGGSDVIFHPWTFMAFGAGSLIRVAPFQDARLEALEMRLSVRTYPWRGLHANASMAISPAGRDPTDIRLGLDVGWTFGRH